MVSFRSCKIMMISVVASILVLNFPIKVLAEGPVNEPTAAQSEGTGSVIENNNPSANEQKQQDITKLDEDKKGETTTEKSDPTIITPSPSPNEVKNDVTVTNELKLDATSGNALVNANTTAGDAKTGDASSTTTLMNTVNSTLSSSENKEVASFVKDITGDVNGDLILQPLLLKAMLESGQKSSMDYANVINNTTLTNNLNLNATSGDASVTDNTKAGNATTGNASTVANVVNIINSMISANQSFIGTINIYGNLNGDILIAPDFIPQLLSSNGIKPEQVGTATIDMNDTQSIVNNVSLAAESGKASVLNNTKAGNAISGNANTNVVIFNLSGHEIIASNSLLVFVNVLGKWVGVIVDAPEGATAAAIGDGVTDNKMAPNMILSADNNSKIINNITLNSKSGDALVKNNTEAGNATSGNATSSVNIANISNSMMGLSGWFGVLFINVFGNWFGSFGVDTSNGNPVQNINTDQSLGRPIEFIPRVSRHNAAIVIDKDSGGKFKEQIGREGLASIEEVNSEAPVTVKNEALDQKKLNEEKTAPFGLNGFMVGAASIGAVSVAGVRRIRRIRS